MTNAARRQTTRPVKQYGLTLGARNTVGAGRHFSAKDDREIRRITRSYFPDGFTITSAQGGWWDKNSGTFRLEDSRQITVRSESRGRVRRWAQALGIRLKQQELLIVEAGPSFIVPINAPGQRRNCNRRA